MNALEIAIKKALETQGDNTAANKAYLEFMKANFIIPIERKLQDNSPVVLFLQEDTETYLPVFSNQHCFDVWAHDIRDKIQVLKLSGVDLLKGIGEQIFICLNPGDEISKIFNPQEIARLKGMVLKLFK